MASKCDPDKEENFLPKRLDNMAQNINDWATNEMNYKGSGSLTPNVTDLKELCIGPMMDIFPFIVKHVKSKQTVQKIRGNVRLHPNILDSDSNGKQIGKQLVHNKIKALDSKKSCLKPELEEKRRTLVILKKKVEDKTGECFLKEGRQDQLMKMLDDSNGRKILLEAQSSKTREKTEDLQRYEALLAGILERCEPQTNGKVTTYINRDGDIVSVCMQNVQDSCKVIEESVKRRIDSDVFDDQALAENIFETVKETMQSHDESEIMEYLIKSAETNIDCKANDNDNSQDQFSANLHTAKISQINTFVKTKDSQIVTHDTKNKKMETVKAIEEKLIEIYDNDDKSLNMSRRVIKVAIEEAKLKGKIEFLKRESISLNEKLLVLDEKCKSLDVTYDSIVLEEEKVKQKQKAVVSFLSCFKTEIATLDTHQQEVKEMVTKFFHRSNLDEIDDHLQLLRNSTVSDVESLLSLPLHDTDGGDFTLDQNIGSNFGQKDEMSLSEIVKLKEAVRRKQRLVDSQTYLMDSITSCERGLDSDSIAALSDSVSKLKAQKTELLLSEVQEFLQTATKRVVDTETIKDTVRTWWEQPAQNIDLGLTIDNKSIKDWIN